MAWGAAHALLYIPVFVWTHITTRQPSVLYTPRKTVAGYIKDFLGIIATFGAVVATWLLFRAETIGQAVLMFKKMVMMLRPPFVNVEYLWYVAALIFLELMMRGDERNPVPFKKKWARYMYYCILIYVILLHVEKESSEFIYFRF